MSPIVDLQRSYRELGRLRMGVQVPNKGKPGTHPARLSTWRLTSSQRDSLDRAAAVYGGEVQPWKDGSDVDAFELITEASEVRILIPPGAPLSQWNEMWGGGGCLRRCDGQREFLHGTACLCPHEPTVRVELAKNGEACKTTTRLPVALPELPDVGIWLLVTHGYYAARELQGTADLLAATAQQGLMLPALLAIEERHTRRPGEGRKDFTVPVIRIPASIAELSAGRGVGDMPEPYRIVASSTPSRPALPAGPALPADPGFATAAHRSTETSQEAPRAASSGPAVVVAARPVAASGGLCLAPSPYGDGTACGLVADHLTDPANAKLHRSIGQDGDITGSWPA